MKTKIFHNPRCSKSRQTLKLLNERGIEPEIIYYLVSPPSAEEIVRLSRQMGQSVASMLRKGEKRAKELALDLEAMDESALAKILADNPILIERPIVVAGDRAVIGRPPENIALLFD